MHFLIIITIISKVLNLAKNLSDTCISNLECQSACCRVSCVEQEVCKTDIRNIYIAVGIVGIVFLIIIGIYFVWSIKETRENVKKLRDNENKNN